MSPATATGFTVLIPARMASSRLPEKPLADIGGLPMVVRVAQAAQRSGAEQVVVACDHPRIQAACAQHGVPALLTRADHPSGSDRLAEACELLGLTGFEDRGRHQPGKHPRDPGRPRYRTARMTRSANRSISSSCGLHWSSSRFTPASSMKTIATPSISGAPCPSSRGRPRCGCCGSACAGFRRRETPRAQSCGRSACESGSNQAP